MIDTKTKIIALILMLSITVLFGGLSIVAQDEPPPDDDDTVEVEIDVDEAEDVAGGAVDLTEDVATSAVTTAEEWLERLVSVPRSDVVRVLFVILGVILLVAGWRIYEFIILVTGVLIGASVALALVPSGEVVLEIAAFLLGGLLGAVLAFFLYYLAVFFIGGYVGITLTAALVTAISGEPVSVFLLLIGAVIGGIVLLMLSSELLVFVSAIVGAQLLTLSLDLEPYWMLIFAVIGILIQLGAARYTGRSIRRRPNRRLLRT